MKKVLMLFVLLFSMGGVQSQGCLQMDIMLIGDLSGSIDDNEYFVANAFAAFVSKFELSDNTVKIGAIVFSEETILLSHLTSKKGQLLTSIDFIRNNDLSGTTRMGDAILEAWSEFTLYGRSDVRRMIIMVSDGAVDEPSITYSLIQTMKAQTSVEFCGIYVDTYGGNPDYVANISEPYCYVSTSYSILVQELEKLDLCI